MHAGSWQKLLWGAALGLGCSGPSLDLPSQQAPRVSIELEPRVDEGSVPLLFRARLRDAPAGEPWLFRDELSDYHARELKRGDVPAALYERSVPLRFWRDGADCWLQPLVWLQPDATYTLAFRGVGVLRVVRAEQGDVARARRLFPAAHRPKHGVAVVCDAGDVRLPSALSLEPGGKSLQAAPGVAGLSRAGCVTLTVDGELTDVAVAPPALPGTGALLDPSPWLPSGGSVAKSALACDRGQLFHGACLEVLDDRLLITPQLDDALWMLDEPQASLVVAEAGVRSLLTRELAADSAALVRGTVLSSRGELEAFETTLTTTRERRHLVLNEVLANPVGPEPDAEWIELVNDSARTASLSGLWLEDSGGSVPLPNAELAPGEIALLVGEGFQASGLDVPVPDDVRRLVVASLGARGLSNSGEALLLVGAEGVLSRFPLLAAPHAGRSIARRTLDAADDDPANFAEQAPPGASPGAPNSFESGAD